MSPADARTPEELFGPDAIADKASLRRAYSRLIKVHSPETDPTTFQHIRGLYERALAVLAPTAVVEAANDGHRAELIVRCMNEENFEVSRDSLDRLALGGDVAALHAAFLLRHAVDPASVVDWLLGLVGPPSAAIAALLAAHIYASETEVLASARLPAVVRLLGPDGAIVVEAWFAWLLGRVPERGAVAWVDHGDLLLRLSPERWARLRDGVCRRAGPFMSADDVARELERLDDVSMPEPAPGTRATLVGYRALLNAQADEALTPALRLALAAVLSGSPAVMVGAGRDPTLLQPALASGLADRQPELLEILQSWLDFRSAALIGWLETGKPAAERARAGWGGLRQMLAAGLIQVEGATAALRDRRAAMKAEAIREWEVFRARQNRRLLGVLMTAFLVFGVVKFITVPRTNSHEEPPEALAAGLAAGLLGAWWTQRTSPMRWIHAPDVRETQGTAEWLALDSELADAYLRYFQGLCSRHGWWVHDLAQAAEQLAREDVAARLEPLLLDPLSDLGFLSDNHARRALFPVEEPG